MFGDVLSVESDTQSGEPLLELVLRDGRRIASSPSLEDSRARAAREPEQLPDPLRRLEPGAQYLVEVTDAVKRLAAEVDHRLAQHQGAQV
jgi:nicotinate phosphoribosyltransferase